MANIFDDLENQDGLVVDEKELLKRRLEAQQNPFLASEQASSSMPASPLQERFDAGIVERMKIPTLKGQDVSIDEQTGLITSIPSPVEPEKIKTEASIVSDDDLNFIDKGIKKDLAGTLDDLTKKFGKHGITFKVNADGGYETRLSDRYERIEVIAANQTKKDILYDAFTKSIVKSDANELKSFIKSNAIKTNYVPKNREEAEAIQAYSKQGLDYGLVKKNDNDMKALETSIKEANAINDLIESNARKAATSTGKVALAYKAKAKELESQFKNEYGVTPQAYIDSNSQKLKSLRDVKISNLDKSIKADREIQGRVKVLDEKAKALLGESNKLIESSKELSINGLGVPLFKDDGSFNEEGLKKIVPNQANQGVINQIRHNLTLSDNYRKAAHSGKLQAMNYLSAQQNKNVQDQYVSNWEGFLNNATNAYRNAESTMLSLATSAAKWAGKEELAKLWNDRMLEQMYKPPLDVSSDQELINLIRQYGDPDDYLKSLGPDPLRAFNAAANMTVSSMLLFLPQMISASGTGAGISGTLAALGTLAVTRNPALARQAFMTGASTGSRVGAQYVAPTSLEYSTSLIDAIRKKYPTIEEARGKDWWNDKEIMDEALRLGVSRGIPITGAGAMFDLLSKKFAPLATASKARRVGQTLAVGAAIAPVIEGAGEAAAQYASVGELDWKDIIDESVGSLGSSTVIPTLPYEVYSQLNKDYYINLADKMAKSPSFLGSMEESMEQIRDWTGRMKATRQITDDVERQIMGNMSAILEARKLLTSPDASNSERTYNRLFGTKSAAEERLSKLLLAQKKMEETPKINRELQKRIQEEIDYTVTNGKPIDKQQAVNLTPIIGSEGAMYKIGDTLVTRDDVKEALVDKEKAKELGLKEDFSNLSIENDQVLKNVVKQVSPKKVLFQQPGVSDTPSAGKTIVFHGGTLDKDGNIYVSPSREQAAEYAKMSKTSVMEFEIDPENMAKEDEVRDAFEELGLQLPEGYNLDELFLYEALDPRLPSSLKKEDIKKLYDHLKQKGYEGISFIDEDILGKDRKGVSNYIVFAKESLKPIKRDTPKASEAASVLGTIAKSKDIFNKIGEIVANWVDGDIEIDEQTGNIKITQSLDGKKIVGVPASKLIDFLFSDAPFDTRKFPVDKEWIDTVVKLRDSIIEESRVQKKKTKEKRVAKKGSIISGDEIATSATKMGTDGGFSEFTLKRIAKEDYTEEEVSIEGLLMSDPSLKEYVDAGQLRAQPEAKPGVVEQGSRAFFESVKAAFPKRGMFGGVVITDADGTELAEVSLQIKDDEKIVWINNEIPKIELSSFLSLKAGSREGFGKRALSVMKDMADKHGVQLLVYPEPLRFLKIKGVNKKFLERFYKNSGFKSPHRLSPYMVYLPQTKTSDTTKRTQELPKSNKEISEIIKALFKGERDALENVLFNWDGIELVFDEIYDEIKFKGYVGRDRQFSRGAEGGTRVASKKEFLRWLMSDEPNNVEEFGEDAEWISNINKLRAVVDGLTIGEPAPQQQTEATVGIPPIVSSNGDVIDGYNRILQAVMDGKDSIKVLKGIPKEAPIPKRKPPMQRLMEAGVKAGISAKNITDLYNVNRDVFGLNISQSIANSIVMDRMMGAMAKRKGVSKDEIYKSIKFQNVTEEFIKTLSEESKPLFQMVGKNAKLSAQVFAQLDEAKKMRAENTVQKLRAPNDPPKYSALDIKLRTGWEFNPVDNKWRYEIDYGKAKDISLNDELWSKYDQLTKKGYEKTTLSVDGYQYDFLRGYLSDFLDNQELFDAYPNIKDVKFKIKFAFTDVLNNVPITESRIDQILKRGFEGSVMARAKIRDVIASGGEITLDLPAFPGNWSEAKRIEFFKDFFSKPNVQAGVLALINHEVQHLIQQEEGFIEGSNVPDKYRGTKGLELLMRRSPKQKAFDNNQKTFIKGKFIDDALGLLGDWYEKFPNSTNEQSLGLVLKATKDTIKRLEDELEQLKQNESRNKNAIRETVDRIEASRIGEKLLVDIYYDIKPDEDLVAYLEKLRGRYFGTLYKRNVIPYQVYYRVAGEAEARTASDRGRMPADVRQRTLISDTTGGVSLAERLAFAYPGTLKFQGPQGAVAIGQDASAVIYAISNPNVTTPLHELAHVFESYLTEKERKAVMNSAGTPNEWNVTTSEYFARGFERYLAEGVAPSTILKSLFEAFKSWLIEIYNGITGSDIDVELNEAMRGIYSSMLGFERPKPTIVSYFSGSGTMEAAFGGDVRSGLAVEFSPEYIKAYNKAFGKDYEPRDVNEVSPQEIKDIDPLLFHASPVCKNYSLAKDPSQRGTTDLDIKSAKSVAAAISTAKPPIVTIENVGGYKGDVPYNIIIEALEKAGYKYDANIYDVADYGAVQTRKRVLVRAIREGELPPLPDKIGPKDWYSAIEDLIPNAPDYVIGEQAKRNIDKAMGRKPEAIKRGKTKSAEKIFNSSEIFEGQTPNQAKLFFADTLNDFKVPYMFGQPALDPRSDMTLTLNGAKFLLSENQRGPSNYVLIDDFLVNEDLLGTGKGREALVKLIEYADKNGITLVGEPLAMEGRRKSSRKGVGLSQKDLTDFYKRYGFTKISKESLSNVPVAETGFFERKPQQQAQPEAQVEATAKALDGVDVSSLSDMVSVPQTLETKELDKIPRGETFQEKYAPEYFEKLKKDIKENGIKEPVTLKYYVKDNAIRLIEGHHRLKIAKELGIENIPVKVDVVWGTSIVERNEDIKGKPILNPPTSINEEKYSKRNYAPSNIAIEELGYKNKFIAEAYHKAKADGSNPKLVQAVDKILGQPQLTDYDYFWQSKLGKKIQKRINIGYSRGKRGFKVNRNQIKLFKSSLPIIVMGEGQYGPMAANSGGPAPTLVSSSAQTAFIVLPETKQLKVLTPRMMARIMDLPDTYTVPSDYKTAKEVLGNGMSGVLTTQFIMPLIFGNSVTLAKNPNLLFQQPGAKQNTFENDGTMLNVDANAPVIAGSNLPPTVKKATAETDSEYYAEYRASDLIKTTHAPSSAFVGLIRSLSSGQVSNPKITINLPFENKNVTNKIDQLTSEYQKLGDKAANKKRKQEITEELNKITKDYMGEVVKKMTLNILALYDTLTPAFIQRARNWYVGANRIANTMASKYGLSLEQTAGILAVFSPKTDWQINVSHAERLIDIIRNYSDLKVDKNFIGKVRKKIEGMRKGGVLNDKDEEFLELLSNATSNYPNGMSINEMSDIGFDESTQGLLVRAIMTEKFPKTYAETYPEGDLFRKAKKAYAESSYDFMGKAIRIYRNNSLNVIHEEIGDANKVRNFYNNIVDPFSPVPYVTGDTHAIAAAMGMPLAADDAGLLKLFVGGISPMYTMLKEAYIAATEVVNQNDGTDFLPREMQSIIWEAIRMGMNDLSTTLREELNEELVKNKKENSYEKTRRVLAEFRQKGIRTKNPEWGGPGFSVQVSKILRASKEETNKRVSQVVAVWRQLRGGRGGNLTTALGGEFRARLNNFYASFLASRGDVSRSLELARFLNKAFPGVSVFVDKTSFQEVMKEPETKKFLNGKNNLIYGVTKNGRIYINPDVFASDIELMETMIHEFGHIWINYIKVNNRELYEQGIKLVMSEYPDEYKTELLLNKNNKERAAEEVLATLIGKKGQLEGKAMRRGIAIASGKDPNKVEDTTVAGFSNWLNKMWEYVRKEFRSLRGLSVEEIQNITLTEFIDGALFDLFSGEPVPQSQLAFENSLVQEPQFNSSTSMYDLINQARNDGYRDAEIRRVLEVNGFAAEDINEALKVYLDVLTIMPSSFAQVPGGAFAGQRMYESLMADVQAYAKTGVKSAQVREYAQNKLKDQQLFKDSTEFQRMAMMVDLDKSINISANKAITAEMRKIRAAIAGIKKGKSQMSSIQRSLIAFIKKSLPVSTYEKKDVVDLIRKIQALDLNNIDQIKREVFDYVTRFRIKNEKERLQTLLSTKLAKLESSRLKGLMSVEFQQRFSELKSNLMGESDALTNPSKVEDKIAELNVEFLDVQNQVFAQGMNELWGKMEDLQFAIQYNSTLLLDDDNPNKLLSLEELVEKVDALISAERSSFKDFLKSESERYNEMKNYLLYDISSGKYDINFNNKEEVENAIAQIQNDQLDEKKRNWFMAAINRIVSVLDLSVLNTEDLDSVIDRISKATGQLFGGIAQELIGQRIDDSRDNFIALRAMAKEMISQNAERIFGKNYRDVMERNSKKSVSVEINRDTTPAKRMELSQNEMYYLYNLYKDPANHPGFKTLMGNSYPEIMDEIIRQLDPQLKEWADWQVDEFYPAMYPIYNEVYKSIYRTNMPWNAHYAGRVFREGVPDFSTIDFLRDPKGFKMFAGGQSTKARVKNSAAIRPMDGDYVLRSYIKDMNFFAAFGEAFRDLSKLLNSPLIRKAMDAFVGEDVRKYLGLQQGEEKGGVLDAVLSANLNRSNEPAILESITKGYVFAKLGINFRVFLYQAASFLNFTMFIGYRNYALFAAKAFGNLATGGKSNAYRLFKEMYENSQYLRDREDTESILDLMAGFNSKNAKGETKSLLDRVTEGSVGAALMFMLRNGDKAGIAGSIPNYLYYKTEYANRYGVDLDSQEAIDYAIKKVNKQVRKVAQDNESENKSLLQSTGGAIAKGFYLFASQPLQLFRMEIRAVRNIYRILAGLEGAKGTLQENARVFITAHFVSPLVFQWLALGLPGVARKWNDDDEDELILAAIIGNLNQLFVLGQLLDTAKDAILKKPWAKVPETAVPYKIVTQLAVLMVDAINTKDADKRLDAQIKFSIAIAELSGIPAGTMLGLFKNYEKLLKGEVSGFGEAFLRMFNFPERQITRPKKEKNPYDPSSSSSKSRKSKNPYTP